jgi:hypothetical protein
VTRSCSISLVEAKRTSTRAQSTEHEQRRATEQPRKQHKSSRFRVLCPMKSSRLPACPIFPRAPLQPRTTFRRNPAVVARERTGGEQGSNSLVLWVSCPCFMQCTPGGGAWSNRRRLVSSISAASSSLATTPPHHPQSHGLSLAHLSLACLPEPPPGPWLFS